MSNDNAQPGAIGALLFAPEAAWRAVQAERLASHLKRAGKSALYRDVPLAIGPIRSEMLDSVLAGLPLTTKDQLSAAGAGAWAAGADEVREWVCTSGTTGRPLDLPVTKGDLVRIAENEAVALSLAGVRAGDVCLLAVGMDRLFVAGLAYWLGTQAIGATCVRLGPHVANQASVLKGIADRVCRKGQRTFLIAVPSFLVEADPITLEGIVAIGEPIRATDAPWAHNTLGARLQGRFGCPVMSTYATTETCTTFAEGPACVGGHLNPALAIVEVLDEAGMPVPPGVVGEVTVTPLGVEGLPLVRFQTGDMAALMTGACPCGRTTPRLGPIVGRRHQLLKVRGTSLYPAAVLEVLREMECVADVCVVAERENTLSDRLTVQIALKPGVDEGGARRMIEARMRAVLRVTPAIGFAGMEALRALQQSAGGRKATRFIDRRG